MYRANAPYPKTFLYTLFFKRISRTIYLNQFDYFLSTQKQIFAIIAYFISFLILIFPKSFQRKESEYFLSCSIRKPPKYLRSFNLEYTSLFQCPVTVSSSLTSSSASPVSGAILSAGGSSLVSVASTATNHPLGVAAGLSNARMAVTSAVVRPPGSPTTSVSPSQGHPPPTTGGPTPTGRCCDTGRPIFTDPLTGQTVCSCQYELIGGYQRLGALPTAALSMYSAPYAAAAAAAASEGMAAYFPSLGAEQAPFYTPTVS